MDYGKDEMESEPPLLAPLAIPSDHVYNMLIGYWSDGAN